MTANHPLPRQRKDSPAVEFSLPVLDRRADRRGTAQRTRVDAQAARQLGLPLLRPQCAGNCEMVAAPAEFLCRRCVTPAHEVALHVLAGKGQNTCRSSAPIYNPHDGRPTAHAGTNTQKYIQLSLNQFGLARSWLIFLYIFK
jgi:hypothetical protein